jgi:hypothetical protein
LPKESPGGATVAPIFQPAKIAQKSTTILIIMRHKGSMKALDVGGAFEKDIGARKSTKNSRMAKCSRCKWRFGVDGFSERFSGVFSRYGRYLMC